MEIARCVFTAPKSIPMAPALGRSLEKGAWSPPVRDSQGAEKGRLWEGVGLNIQFIRNFCVNPTADTLISQSLYPDMNGEWIIA